jgi:hypothetical protein
MPHIGVRRRYWTVARSHAAAAGARARRWFDRESVRLAAELTGRARREFELPQRRAGEKSRSPGINKATISARQVPRSSRNGLDETGGFFTPIENDFARCDTSFGDG